MDKELKNKNFESFITNIEETDDPRYTKAEVWVCHTGWNLNGSYMSKETIEKAGESITGIPLVGFIQADVNEDKADFAGHEEDIKITEDGVEYIYRGTPFGFVPESAEQRFEIKIDANGVEREYYVTDAVLWNAFEGTKLANRDGIKGQSMELHPEKLEYQWVEDLDGESGFEITDMLFDKLCALGDTVTPAMTGALIETFTKKFSVDGFMAKVREYESSQGGGKVDKNKEPKLDNTIEEPVEEPEVVEELGVKNELSVQQKMSMVEKVLRNDLGEVWVKDMSDSIVVFYHWDSGILKQANYTIDGEMVTIDMESIEDSAVIVKPKSQIQDSDLVLNMTEHTDKLSEKAVEKFEVELEHELGKEIDGLKELSKDLNDKLESNLEYTAKLEDSLAEYQTQEKVDLIDSVENLTEDDALELKSSVDEYSYNELKDKIFNIIGRNSAKFTKSKEGVMRMSIPKPEPREKFEEELEEKPDELESALSVLNKYYGNEEE